MEAIENLKSTFGFESDVDKTTGTQMGRNHKIVESENPKGVLKPFKREEFKRELN